METLKQIERFPGCLPYWIDQSALTFPVESMSGSRQNSKVKARFIGNQKKARRYPYSIVLTNISVAILKSSHWIQNL